MPDSQDLGGVVERSPARAFAELNAEALGRVERLCWEFERQLRQGEQPVIEPMLPRVTPEDRAVLLPEGDFLPIRLQRVDGHWKVDARPIIAARKAAAAAQPKTKGQ